jgi:dTMP kinase
MLVRVTRRFEVLRSLISAHDFRRLVTSQILGGLAEWLATLALIALVWERTHSAFASGIVLALRILPAAVFTSFFGILVDRFDRRRVLVACTAGRACIYGTLPLVGGVAPVLVLALVAEVGTLAYVAARDATVPRLVPREHLAAANALSMASTFAAMPAGSGLFAAASWLQGAAGYPGFDLALLVASGLFAVSTLMLGRLALVALEPPQDAVVHAGVRPRLRAVLAADPVLRRVVVGGFVVACCGGSLLTLGLAYVRTTLNAGEAAYGGLLSTFCAGAVVGVVALQRMRGHLPKIFHAGAGAMGAILFAMALFPSTALGFGMAFVFGGAFVATFLGGITILQDRVDDAVRGRAFALAHSGLRVGAVAVGLLGAWAAKMLGAGAVLWTMDATQVVLAAAGLVIVAVTVVLIAPRRRAVTA